MEFENFWSLSINPRPCHFSRLPPRWSQNWPEARFCSCSWGVKAAIISPDELQFTNQYFSITGSASRHFLYCIWNIENITSIVVISLLQTDHMTQGNFVGGGMEAGAVPKRVALLRDSEKTDGDNSWSPVEIPFYLIMRNVNKELNIYEYIHVFTESPSAKTKLSYLKDLHFCHPSVLCFVFKLSIKQMRKYHTIYWPKYTEALIKRENLPLKPSLS